MARREVCSGEESQWRSGASGAPVGRGHEVASGVPACSTRRVGPGWLVPGDGGTEVHRRRCSRFDCGCPRRGGEFRLRLDRLVPAGGSAGLGERQARPVGAAAIRVAARGSGGALGCGAARIGVPDWPLDGEDSGCLDPGEVRRDRSPPECTAPSSSDEVLGATPAKAPFPCRCRGAGGLAARPSARDQKKPRTMVG